MSEREVFARAHAREDSPHHMSNNTGRRSTFVQGISERQEEGRDPSDYPNLMELGIGPRDTMAGIQASTRERSDMLP